MSEERKARIHYNVFLISFVILNVLATFILTTEKLNRYIISYDYTLGGILNSIIGNSLFLLVILYIILLITRKPKNILVSLLGVTLFLNTALFAINVFNRFYGTAFTFNALAIFKNPGEGFGLTLVWEALRELVTYYRIILYIPFISLIIYYFVIKKRVVEHVVFVDISFRVGITRFFFVTLLFFFNIAFFTSRARTTIILDSGKAAYATQNLGIYNYLVLDSMGFDYKTEEVKYKDVQDELDIYNKNKDSYKNFIDNKTYTKSPLISDINSISGKLLDSLDGNNNVTGLLKDYNLVLIHLETFNNYLLQVPEVASHFVNLRALMNESYVFSNFYTNVGLGNSFDAELAVLTGLMPNGTSTIAWDFNPDVEEKDFDFNTLPKLFRESNNYITNSLHGNTEYFYNRFEVHPKLFGFDKFKGIETILDEKEMTIEENQEKYQHVANKWISDRGMLDYLNEDINNFQDNNQKFMQFLISMMPHTPYFFDPYQDETLTPYDRDLYTDELMKSIDIVTLRYINYAKYYDEFFRILFEDVNGYGDDYVYNEDNLYNRKKTAYVFYGDHGSGIKHKDIATLFNKEDMDTLEARMKLLNTTSFIYVPGDEIVTTEYEDGTKVHFREGLLKGNQPLVRGQLDLHRTIVDLFDLPVKKNDFLFGVHGMSTEPTFSLDNKALDLVTDRFFGTIKNSRLILLLGDDVVYDLGEIERIKKYVMEFKKYSDIAMNKNLYKDFKNNLYK